jgi:exopolysaccharide biosynthesis protein
MEDVLLCQGGCFNAFSIDGGYFNAFSIDGGYFVV